MKAIAVFGLGAVCAMAQVVPLKTDGVVLHHVQGKVFLNDADVSGMKPGEEPTRVPAGGVLHTSLGLAEVLLAPGVVMRSGENTAVRVVSESPLQISLFEGAITIEVGQPVPLTVAYKDARVEIQKAGIYRLGGDPPEAMVYEGEAEVTVSGASKKVKRGGAMSLVSKEESRKFDTSKTDSLMRWSSRRANSMGLANLAAARYYFNNNLSWAAGGWVYNPYFGLYTYLPIGRGYRNPWGYYYYSPSTVYAINRPQAPASTGSGFNSGPRYAYDSQNGYNTVSQRTYESYNPPAASAPAAAPAAAAAPAPARSGEGSAGRGGEGGGRSQ